MIADLLEDHKKLIDSIAKENGFEKYELDIESGANKGDNYMGNIVRLWIKTKDKKLSLVMKTAPTNEKVRIAILAKNIYLKEIYMYEKVLPILDKFQSDNGLQEGFKGYAKFYGKCPEEYKEALVLENLFENGYKMWDRKSPMNPDHIALVLREHGKFHAASIAMKGKNPEFFEKIVAQHIAQTLNEQQIKSWTCLAQSVAAAIPAVVAGNPILEKAAGKFIMGLENFMFREIYDEPDKMIITHGDSWCNNMLFKYEDPQNDKNPTKVCFIDWQLSRMNPPVLDFIYFFCTSAPKETLYDYQKYLRIYHDSLSQSLRSMSCDPEDLYSYEDLARQWKKYSKFGFFIANVILKIMAAESEEAPNISEIVDSEQDYWSRMVNMGSLSSVKQRLQDVLQFLVDNDLM